MTVVLREIYILMENHNKMHERTQLANPPLLFVVILLAHGFY